MKKRLISASIMIIICLPCLIIGGIPFKLLSSFVIVVSAIELSRLKDNKVNYNKFIFLALYGISFIYLDLNLYLIPIGLILLFILIIIFNKNLLIEDMLIIFILETIVSLGLKMGVHLFSINRMLLLYVCIASLLCDAGAYFIGSKYGKHKLCPSLSPNKSIEGAIAGIIFGFFFSFVFAQIFNNFDLSIYLIIALSLLLPFIAQIGDLSFSLIKRHYQVKDFGNLIPGHGGVLDRVDSVVFCLTFIIIFLRL